MSDAVLLLTGKFLITVFIGFGVIAILGIVNLWISDLIGDRK